MNHHRSDPAAWSDHAAILDSLEDAVLVIDSGMRIVYMNAEARRRYGDHDLGAAPCHCHVVTHGAPEPCFESGLICPVRSVLETGAPARAVHHHRSVSGELVPEEITAKPLLDGQGHAAFVVETVRNAAELLADKEIVELMRNQLDLLRGVLPTCAGCKRIRTPEGEWEEMERYVSKHSSAQFSHGLCPDCVARLYPDFEGDPGPGGAGEGGTGR